MRLQAEGGLEMRRDIDRDPAMPATEIVRQVYAEPQRYLLLFDDSLSEYIKPRSIDVLFVLLQRRMHREQGRQVDDLRGFISEYSEKEVRYLLRTRA